MQCNVVRRRLWLLRDARRGEIVKVEAPEGGKAASLLKIFLAFLPSTTNLNTAATTTATATVSPVPTRPKVSSPYMYTLSASPATN